MHQETNRGQALSTLCGTAEAMKEHPESRLLFQKVKLRNSLLTDLTL